MTLSIAGLDLVGFAPLAAPSDVRFEELERVACDGYARSLVAYEGDEGDPIRAYLFIPNGRDRAPGVVAFHQHNSEWHLGKSEVAGLAGSPLQAFGPALAARGVAVLAPDAITFEDRRGEARGTTPGDRDFVQHHNAASYRLMRGDSLLRKVLDDAQRAVSVLSAHPRIDAQRIGTLGHSFGGTTALYHAAVDPRPRFACLSGSLASFRARMDRGTAIGAVEVLPGLARALETADLLASSRVARVLVVSAKSDRFSIDADEVVAEAEQRLAEAGGSLRIEHRRFDGGHPLTSDRFTTIVDWIAARAGLGPP